MMHRIDLLAMHARRLLLAVPGLGHSRSCTHFASVLA